MIVKSETVCVHSLCVRTLQISSWDPVVKLDFIESFARLFSTTGLEPK